MNFLRALFLLSFIFLLNFLIPSLSFAQGPATCNLDSDCPDNYRCIPNPEQNNANVKICSPSCNPPCGTGQTCFDNGGGNLQCVDSDLLEGGVGSVDLQNATGTWQVKPPIPWQKDAVNGALNSVSFSFHQFANTAMSAAVLGAGVSGKVLQDSNLSSAQQQSLAGGAVGFLANSMDSMIYRPPATTTEYIASLREQMNIVPSAYAQGTGAIALQPVLPIWKAFRNLAYLGFVIIFVIIGFMIMFQSKVGGQAAVTIQMAIPQIIITLLLVTFSYAIASLFIDLIYVLIYLVVNTFVAFGLLIDNSSLNILMQDNVFAISLQHLIGWSDAAGTAADAIGNVTNTIVSRVLTDTIIDNLAEAVIQVGAYVVLVFAILIATWRLFLQLLFAYLGLIFSIIFAPIILLMNAIPGNAAFGKWFKGLAANALVFPITAIMYLLGAILLGQENWGVNPAVGFNAVDGGAQIGQIALPFLSMNTSGMIGIIGVGFIMFLPKVNEMIQKALGVEGGFMGSAAAALEPIAGAYNKAMTFGRAGLDVAGYNLRYGDRWYNQLAQFYMLQRGMDVPDRKRGGH